MNIFKIIAALLLIQSNILAAVYVDNIKGDDAKSGLSKEESVKTLKKAVAILRRQKDKTLIMENTGTPYYETLRISRFPTTAKSPLTVEGNGAVISGLKLIPAEKWEKQNTVYFAPYTRRGALNPYLVINGKELVRVKGKEKLTPYTHYWAKEGVYFMPEEGKNISSYKLYGTVLASGFAVSHTSYIVCNNLVAEYFSNDGFNVHGDCQALVFNNIVGRYNGDDGFSVHEDVGSTVIGGHFFGNTYGIQDVNAARSDYYSVEVNDNRSNGIDLRGGTHTIIDANVYGNDKAKGVQVSFYSNYSKHLGLKKGSAMFNPIAYMKRVNIKNGKIGIHINNNATAVVVDTKILNCDTGILCEKSGMIEIVRTGIENSSVKDINIKNPDCKIE
jgi:hypothetical protein